MSVTHLELVEAPDPLALLDVEWVRDHHLKSVNGEVEDSYIRQLIATAYRRAERVTRCLLAPQRVTAVYDRFPAQGCDLVIPVAPVRAIVSITYIDEDGVTQNWDGSPAPYDLSLPSGPKPKRASLRPVYDTEWPTTRSQRDAVRVTVDAGFSVEDEEHMIPEDILHGMLLVVGEFYKQRSESVHAFNQNPALIRARDMWLDYRLH